MGVFKINRANQPVDDTPVAVNDFARRAPFWSYRVKDYMLYEPLVKFKEEIDGYLEKLFSGDIDEGNGDVLDNMISDLVRQAEQYLKRQQTEHKDLITSFGIRAKSDQKAFQQELELLRGELARNMEQQKDIQARLYQNEFREGKLYA